MAELNVQPKTGRPWWIWLLLALTALALIFLFRSRDHTSGQTSGISNDTVVHQALTSPKWGYADGNA